jgi:hypothetical protein
MSKRLLIINAIFLSESLSNQASLVTFNRSISFGLDLIDPFTTDCRLARRQSGHVPSMSFVKSIKFIDHSLSPKRISASLTIGMRLMESSKCKVTMIISKVRKRSLYLI